MREVQCNHEERKLGDILNETFSIYGRHFREFLWLAIIAQAPTKAALLVPIGNLTIYIILNLINVCSLIVIFGATIYGVSQHYVYDSINVKDCFKRLQTNMIPMVMLTGIVAILTTLSVTLSLLMPWVFVVSIGILIFGAYVVPCSIVPVIMVEGMGIRNATARALVLTQGGILRMLAHLGVYLLVGLGLGIVLFLPFYYLFPPSGGIINKLLIIGIGAIPAIIVPTLISISVTLLYFDLRIHKEDYSVHQLSQDLGLGSV